MNTLLISVIILAIIIMLYGVFTAGTPRQIVVNNNNTSSSINGIDSLIEIIENRSQQGFRLCFDDEFLLSNPNLLNQLYSSVKLSIAEDVYNNLKSLKKTAQFGFLATNIINQLSLRTDDLKICSYVPPHPLNDDNVDECERIIGAYIQDQNRNLYTYIFITKREEWSRIAEAHGLCSLLV